MDSLFYSPNGSSWNLQGPDVLIDPTKIVTMPVRKYTFKNTMYAIFACAELSFPSDIFYMLGISRPNGADFASTQESEFKIVKQLLNYAPISIGQYKVAEHKLVRKIANRKRQAFVERMKVQNEMMESIKADIEDNKTKNETLDTINKPQPIQMTVADDESGGFGGIMGVYCRSGIHGDYGGICAVDERKIA